MRGTTYNRHLGRETPPGANVIKVQTAVRARGPIGTEALITAVQGRSMMTRRNIMDCLAVLQREGLVESTPDGWRVPVQGHAGGALDSDEGLVEHRPRTTTAAPTTEATDDPPTVLRNRDELGLPHQPAPKPPRETPAERRGRHGQLIIQTIESDRRRWWSAREVRKQTGLSGGQWTEGIEWLKVRAWIKSRGMSSAKRYQSARGEPIPDVVEAPEPVPTLPEPQLVGRLEASAEALDHHIDPRVEDLREPDELTSPDIDADATAKALVDQWMSAVSDNARATLSLHDVEALVYKVGRAIQRAR
jgi:hypothetical protein